jgi:hypothetical protein
MNRFRQVKEILDSSVGGANAPVAGPHRAFWRNQTRDQFVAFSILGLPIVNLGDGHGSNLVMALRGQTPFGQDTGAPSASFRRMPAGRDPLPTDQIEIIATWIDDGCPDDDDGEVSALEAALNDGGSFLVVSDDDHRFPGRLTLRTTDGSSGEVDVRTAGGGATIQASPARVQVSGSPVEVELLATGPSSAPEDTTIQVTRGANVLAELPVTAISSPAVRFRGTFQCRLPTDPDPYDHQWGENSSFGVYAVQGPDPSNPDEPPLDRIVRFHDPVALRPFCDSIGVNVVSIDADVGGGTVAFDSGDRLIGQEVRLGPACVFDGRNRTFAPDGFEPIADFQLEIGTLFSGASAPAVARPSPADPPGSTAPYASGIIALDADPAGGSPADFGLPFATWTEYSWATLAIKQAQLAGQETANDREQRIRDRRIQEYADTRPGHGLGALRTPLVFMERYTGLIDKDVTTPAETDGMLSFLRTLPAVRVTVDFLAFDSDCQTGRVTGTLDAPPDDQDALLAASRAEIDESQPVGLRRVPLSEQ